MGSGGRQCKDTRDESAQNYIRYTACRHCRAMARVLSVSPTATCSNGRVLSQRNNSMIPSVQNSMVTMCIANSRRRQNSQRTVSDCPNGLSKIWCWHRSWSWQKSQWNSLPRETFGIGPLESADRVGNRRGEGSLDRERARKGFQCLTWLAGHICWHLDTEMVKQ